jgi:hypothetical protein
MTRIPDRDERRVLRRRSPMPFGLGIIRGTVFSRDGMRLERDFTLGLLKPIDEPANA